MSVAVNWPLVLGVTFGVLMALGIWKVVNK